MAQKKIITITRRRPRRRPTESDEKDLEHKIKHAEAQLGKLNSLEHTAERHLHPEVHLMHLQKSVELQKALIAKLKMELMELEEPKPATSATRYVEFDSNEDPEQENAEEDD